MSKRGQPGVTVDTNSLQTLEPSDVHCDTYIHL